MHTTHDHRGPLCRPVSDHRDCPIGPSEPHAYWHVDDGDDLPPDVALDEVDPHVAAGKAAR